MGEPSGSFASFDAAWAEFRVRQGPGWMLTERQHRPVAVVALVAVVVLYVVLEPASGGAAALAFGFSAALLGAGAALALGWRHRTRFDFAAGRLAHERGFAWAARRLEAPLEEVEAIVVAYQRAVQLRPGEALNPSHAFVEARLRDGRRLRLWSHRDSERAMAFGRLLAERAGRPLRDERPAEVVEAERQWREALAEALGEATEAAEPEGRDGAEGGERDEAP